VLGLEQWMDIKDLHRQGLSAREIARRTGFSRNTVAKVLDQRLPQLGITRDRPSNLDPFKEHLTRRYQECALSGVRLHAEIQAMGYLGSYDVVRRYVQTLAPQKRALESATVRFETPPGVQAQADWAYCGRFHDLTGHEVPIYMFLMVLGYSRMLFIEFTTSMELPTLLACHKRAFDYFGGWTTGILYDNMKQVRISPGVLNGLFLDFANYYGFTPKTHRVRRPRTKGKVERMVNYVKDNFLNGRSFVGLDDLNAQGRHWLAHTANNRLHGTTGQRPVDLWHQESLVPVSSLTPYCIPEMATRKVDRESFVRLAGSRYSVPPIHVGKEVSVLGYGDRIVVRTGDLIIAEHARAVKPGSCVAAGKHLSELWKLAMPPGIDNPAPHWQITFNDVVATTPLQVYEEAALTHAYEEAA